MGLGAFFMTSHSSPSFSFREPSHTILTRQLFEILQKYNKPFIHIHLEKALDYLYIGGLFNISEKCRNMWV
jgi:hypothetical protein